MAPSAVLVIVTVDRIGADLGVGVIAENAEHDAVGRTLRGDPRVRPWTSSRPPS